MAKCYLTGLEIDLDSAYILDRVQARRTIQALRQQLIALERLVEQLEPVDKIPVVQPGATGAKTKKQRRVISKRMAHAYLESYPGMRLFVPWKVLVKGEQFPCGRPVTKTECGVGDENEE